MSLQSMWAIIFFCRSVHSFHILKTRFKKTLVEILATHWQCAIQLGMSLSRGQNEWGESSTVECQSGRRSFTVWVTFRRHRASGGTELSESRTRRNKARVQPWERSLESKDSVLGSGSLGGLPREVLWWDKGPGNARLQGQGYNHPTGHWLLIHRLKAPSPRTMSCTWEAVPTAWNRPAWISDSNKQWTRSSAYEACHPP